MKGCASARFRPATLAACAILIALALPAYARPQQHHGEHGGAPHPAMRARGHQMGNGSQHRNFSSKQNRNFSGGPRRAPERVPPRGADHARSLRAQNHPGGEHLSEWFQNHQHLTLQQQERALRRQPGFNRLSPAQRRRVLRQLRFLDSQPPAARARLLARNEAFERLSPERKQEVRAAAQAFRHLPANRKQQLGRAFHVLRTLPPDQRAAILHSARFRVQFSARERHILSNMLSIEPWQPPQPPPPQSNPRH